MSKASAAIGQSDPRERETKSLCDTIQKQVVAGGPQQSSVLLNPFGYGADEILAAAYRACRSGRLGPKAKFAGALAPRHDLISDWPSLAVSIISAAHAAEPQIGASREDLMALRSKVDGPQFGDYVEERLAEISKRGPFVIFAPRLDLLIARLEERDDWTFRNALQESSILLIGEAPQHWRPKHKEAFYEYFRRVQLSGYTSNDLIKLGTRLGLTKPAQATLTTLSQTLDGRPALMESAAARLLLNPNLSVAELSRHLAVHNATFLEEALAKTAPQARLLFAEAAVDGFPTTSTRLRELTGMSSSKISGQLPRLEDAQLLRPDKTVGRYRKYEPLDQVFAFIYRASITQGAEPTSIFEDARTETEPA